MVVASCDTDQMPEPSSAAAAAAPATRVRTIVLSRRGRAQPGSGSGGGGGGGGGVFGFSVRGGREHGTGFFVSRVEPGSEAQLRGLQVGDQIVRVNGLPVAEALHHELLQLVAQQTRLCLAVRTVGMLPVKDDDHNMMTWQMVTVQTPDPAVSVNGSQDIQLILSVPPGTKLGCGICRGPEWRPGVFVQFTKEGGLARTAGLRAGDQILQCNGVPFTEDFPFSEAVALLKAARQLVLVIRPGAGADLFPSESSGYNSSASSIAGDTSPNPAEKQRLSIVNESPEDRIPSRESLVPEEIKLTSSPNPSTVIHICPETPSENRNGHLAQVRLVQQQQETKTVLVEVHRADDKPNSSVPCPPPPMNPLAPTPVLSKSDSASSISSFSSALSQEIERRRNQRREGNGAVEIVPRRVKLTGVNDEKRHQHEQLMQEFKRAHRKMFSNNAEAGDDGCSHGRSISSEERNSPTNNQVNGDKESVRDRIQNLNSGRYGQSSSPLPPPSPSNSGSPTWSSKRSSFDQSSVVSSGGSTTSFGPPPCPTPDYDTSSLTSSMSASSSADSSKFTNGFGTKLRPVNGVASTIPKAPPFNNMLTKPSANGSVILQKSVSSTNLSKSVSSTNLTKSVSSTNLINNASHIKSSPVMNTKQDSSGASTQNKGPPKMPSDGVEMESLESFELTNPSNPEPRPPETYFPYKRPLSSAASSPKSTISNASTITNGRKSRPVSVTIGEYPSGTARREPSKFSFLNGTDMPDGNGSLVTDRLQSELMRTLNRSDLKRRTEQESIVNGSANVQSGNPISAKGTVTVSVNAIPVQNPPVRLFEANGNAVLPKTAPAIRNVAEKLNGSLNGTSTGNRVTIRVGSEPSEQQ